MKAFFLLAIVIFLASCGGNESVEYRKGPSKKPTAEPSPEYTEVALLVQAHCGKCHGPGKGQKGIDSPERVKGASGRVANDSMPPGGGLPQDVKDKILNYAEKE